MGWFFESDEFKSKQNDYGWNNPSLYSEEVQCTNCGTRLSGLEYHDLYARCPSCGAEDFRAV